MKRLLLLQTAILAGGVVFSWTALTNQFLNFYNTYGTMFQFGGTLIPNPFVTACFYGSLAFLAAFVWSVTILRKPDAKNQKYLRNFLLFGVAFATSVITYELVVYYKIYVPPVQVIGCAPGVFPLVTPCFFGDLFFIAAFLVGFYTSRQMAKQQS